MFYWKGFLRCRMNVRNVVALMELYFNDVPAATKFQLELSPPDFSTQHVEDPFRGLGPLTLFSAKRHWSAPRHVTLHRRGEGFGLSVKGSAPVSIASIDEGSPAEVNYIQLWLQFSFLSHVIYDDGCELPCCSPFVC